MEDLDFNTIAKFAGVFVAALLAINAFEYLFEAFRSGNVTGNMWALFAVVFLFALLVALVLQSKRPT